MMNDEPLGRRPKGKAMMNRRQTECKQVYLELPRCEGGKDCVAGLMLNDEPLGRRPKGKAMLNVE